MHTPARIIPSAICAAATGCAAISVITADSAIIATAATFAAAARRKFPTATAEMESAALMFAAVKRAVVAMAISLALLRA